MNERRNLYRLLHLQPDAPSELVRRSYRTLMTKLERHPDLGGDHWNAASLGEAYSTLKDPQKRAAYDQQLLERYDLPTLSRGRTTDQASRGAQPAGLDPTGNQRNYYRVLGVQNDSPAPVVDAAFRALRSSAVSARAITLLEAAFEVLGDTEQRARYDEALARSGHAHAGRKAAARIQAATDEETRRRRARRPPNAGNKKKKDKTRPNTRAEANKPEPSPHAIVRASPATSTVALESPAEYQPLITSYCEFCMTPHGHGKKARESPTAFEISIRCRECDSPLFSPPADLMALGRRGVLRLDRDEAITLRVDWPGPEIRGQAIEISPTGLRCTTAWPIETGERVRVDLSVLCAVGLVAHHRRYRASNHSTGEITEAGIRFLTVAFEYPKGGFLSARG